MYINNHDKNYFNQADEFSNKKPSNLHDEPDDEEFNISEHVSAKNSAKLKNPNYLQSNNSNNPYSNSHISKKIFDNGPLRYNNIEGDQMENEPYNSFNDPESIKKTHNNDNDNEFDVFNNNSPDLKKNHANIKDIEIYDKKNHNDYFDHNKIIGFLNIFNNFN